MQKTYKSARAEYGKTLVELGKRNPNIVVLDADLSCSTQTKQFAKEFPTRFFNVGIAEQDLITTAAGLATVGKIPFVSTFAVFASGRAWEQVRNGVCYSKLNVKIVATHSGVTVGEDGATHEALEDISLMRSIPNMTVIVPADSSEIKQTLEFAAEYDGPVYIRIPRGDLADIFNSSYKFNYSKAVVIEDGSDITLISNGETLVETIDCAKMLKEQGIKPEVVHVPVVKPIDSKTIIESAKKTNKVVTVENHSVIGGLGSAVAEILCENCSAKLKRIGTKDEFGQSGTASELLKFYGLTADSIFKQVMEFIK